MAEQFSGKVTILDSGGRVVFKFDPRYALLDIGATGNEGDIRVRNNNGNVTIHLDGNAGNIAVLDGAGKRVLHFQAKHALLDIGAKGNEGDLRILDGAGKHVFRFDAKYAVLDIGATGNEGDIRVRNNNGNVTIHLDGNTGDIKLSGADCAEEFDILDPDEIEAGTVMVIDQEGKLRQATEAYDKRVVGVVSGAGDSSPGIVLDKKPSENNRMPMALTGKVFCQVDAQFGPIEAGDLLTTSPTAGHAMKASDPLRAFGAVIGKALRGLKDGQRLIPILVSLQ